MPETPVVPGIGTLFEQQAEAVANMITNPVWEMWVDERSAAESVKHKGQMCCFCFVSCQRAFEADPGAHAGNVCPAGHMRRSAHIPIGGSASTDPRQVQAAPPDRTRQDSVLPSRMARSPATLDPAAHQGNQLR